MNGISLITILRHTFSQRNEASSIGGLPDHQRPTESGSAHPRRPEGRTGQQRHSRRTRASSNQPIPLRWATRRPAPRTASTEARADTAGQKDHVQKSGGASVQALS